MSDNPARAAEAVRYAEMRAHAGNQVTGYIPVTVLAEMGIRFEEGKTIWFSVEQVLAIQHHHDYRPAQSDGGYST